MIADNLKSMRQRIANSCDKAAIAPQDITLVCVTKEAGLSEIEQVLGLGVQNLGESRVHDAIIKHRAIGDKAIWHLVGHLQTNKTKDAVRIFSLIHSVDSARLAKEIDKKARKINKVQGILIEVNTSGEKTKFGVRPDETIGLIKEISLYPNIDIKGLMTIAPEGEDPEAARPYFKALRELRDKIDSLHITRYTLHILSMGMSNDFEVAIEEGSNMVRIGRAIFGS